MEKQVKDYLEKLDTFVSAGLDKMHPQVLKKLAEIISEPLVTISFPSVIRGYCVDTVSHNILVSKLRKYRLDENGIHRAQRVDINSLMSNWQKASSGVSQGSVLHLVLLNISTERFGEWEQSYWCTRRVKSYR